MTTDLVLREFDLNNFEFGFNYKVLLHAIYHQHSLTNSLTDLSLNLAYVERRETFEHGGLLNIYIFVLFPLGDEHAFKL